MLGREPASTQALPKCPQWGRKVGHIGPSRSGDESQCLPVLNKNVEEAGKGILEGEREGFLPCWIIAV